MILLDIRGKKRSKSVERLRIDWDAPSRSKCQFKVKQFLEPYWYSHIVYEEFPVFSSRMTVDFLNATYRIAIEVQGNQHSEFNPFFFQNSRAKYLKQIQNDAKKRQWLELNEFNLCEIYQGEVDILSEKFFLDKFGVKL